MCWTKNKVVVFFQNENCFETYFDHTFIYHCFSKGKTTKYILFEPRTTIFYCFFSYFVILLNRFRHFSCCFFLLVVVKLVSSFINMINRQISSCFFPVFCFHLDFNGGFEPKEKTIWKTSNKMNIFYVRKQKWQHITNIYSFSHRIRWMMSINVYI